MYIVFAFMEVRTCSAGTAASFGLAAGVTTCQPRATGALRAPERCWSPQKWITAPLEVPCTPRAQKLSCSRTKTRARDSLMLQAFRLSHGTEGSRDFYFSRGLGVQALPGQNGDQRQPHLQAWQVLDDTDIIGVGAAWTDFVATGREIIQSEMPSCSSVISSLQKAFPSIQACLEGESLSLD